MAENIKESFLRRLAVLWGVGIAVGLLAVIGCGATPKKPSLPQSEPSVTESRVVPAVNDQSPSGVFAVELESIPEPAGELFRPLPLRESKQRLKEVFLEGVADLEAEGMVEAIILEQKEKVRGDAGK
jgi:hypothetical protein